MTNRMDLLIGQPTEVLHEVIGRCFAYCPEEVDSAILHTLRTDADRANNGVTACACGCKYWLLGKCVDCGATLMDAVLDAVDTWDTEEACRWFDNEPTLYAMGQHFARTASTTSELARRLHQTIEAHTPEHLNIDIDAVNWQTVAKHVADTYEGGDNT